MVVRGTLFLNRDFLFWQVVIEIYRFKLLQIIGLVHSVLFPYTSMDYLLQVLSSVSWENIDDVFSELRFKIDGKIHL